MPPITKRVKAARHNGCGDCPSANRVKELSSEVAALKTEIKALKSENEELKSDKRQQQELNNRFPELLAVWRTRYEEAMDKHLNKVLMRGGDVFIPMGVHLREMKTIETWKRKHSEEQTLRKRLEGFIEKFKKNNNELRRDYETQEKALKKAQKMVEMLMPDKWKASDASGEKLDDDIQDTEDFEEELIAKREDTPSTTVEGLELIPKREDTPSTTMEGLKMIPKREDTPSLIAPNDLEMIPKRKEQAIENGINVKEEEPEEWYQPAVKMEVEDFDFTQNPAEASTSSSSNLNSHFP
ncbi:hypothetical protein CRE_28697 [Caenorhabditis remanei]|uniref:Uncharacterized protein n=1 Tax=Caenorhabditis remanei TaxID=31234 RepID=E3MK27_CAERE|nr:hypothetical protein CRE_28697 [Caenorhabditis remanei]